MAASWPVGSVADAFGYNPPMLAIVFLFVALSQSEEPRTFLWQIEGLGDSNSGELTVTVTPTPFGLTQGVAVTDARLVPLAPLKGRKPEPIHPNRTEAALMGGIRAWFTPPKQRFHLLVTFADGATQTIDIYRPVPASDPKPYIVRPMRLIAPGGRWVAP
jgi:hypothetical protein